MMDLGPVFSSLGLDAQASFTTEREPDVQQGTFSGWRFQSADVQYCQVTPMALFSQRALRIYRQTVRVTAMASPTHFFPKYIIFLLKVKWSSLLPTIFVQSRAKHVDTSDPQHFGQSQKVLCHILNGEQARRYEIEVWCHLPFPSSSVWSSQTLRYIDNRTGKVPLLSEFIASGENRKITKQK